MNKNIYKKNQDFLKLKKAYKIKYILLLNMLKKFKNKFCKYCGTWPFTNYFVILKYIVF